MEFFRTENIVKKYANHLALDQVSINVPEKSIFGLLGPNGAGKTTLIRIINRITAPDQGSVFIKGEKLSSKHLPMIGYLPEERGLYKKMKIGEQAVYLARLKGLSAAEATKRLKKWFARFEILSWWDKKVEELSKGMQQKVQFIVTVLHEPPLLIFDEPFTGFDPINTNILKQEILELRARGSTIIFSTHNMASVEELCDDIALIDNAHSILQGSITDVRNKYKPNIYEVKFKGHFNKMLATLTNQYKILDVTELNNTHHVRLELLNSATTNEVITSLLPLGNLVSFNEVIPSMNDIFIRVVEESKRNNIANQ